MSLFIPLFRLPLSEPELQRVREKLANRINKEDELVIQSSEYRSQLKNRNAAWERALFLLMAAARPGKTRRKRNLPRRAKENRLLEKRYRAQKKEQRRGPDPSREL